MLSKSEVEACDRGETAVRAAVEPFLETCFCSGRDYGSSPEEEKRGSFCGEMRGNDCCLIIGVINMLIIR